jgi:hypothetical protein
MGEWRANVTLRIRPALRDELLGFAAREKRSLGNLGALLLEWGLKQLRIAKSTERLLKCRVRAKAPRSKQPARVGTPI